MTSALAEVITFGSEGKKKKKTVTRDRVHSETCSYNQCTLQRAGLIKDLVHG